MGIDFARVETLLPYVLKPGRYIGGEKNQCLKSPDSVKTRICFIFPDVYEIGMSNLGIQILYATVNRQPEYYAERAFAPWKDFGSLLSESSIPLYSLETKTPLRDFDILGVSLQYERLYTNLLYVLDLAGIPLHRKERGESDPIIIAGGPGTLNPEPMSDFVDLFHLGDADRSILEIMDIYTREKEHFHTKSEHAGGISERTCRESVIAKLSEPEYIYNPADHEFIFNDDRSIREIKSRDHRVSKKAIYYDFQSEKTAYPYIIPNIIPVQDKGTLQVTRGCTSGCRFCQAGNTDRPVREKPVKILMEEALELVNQTGIRELSFNSLSIADYSNLPELINEAVKFQDRGINIGLPSLRVESSDPLIAKAINGLRKTGLTFAIETGTKEGRRIINKSVEKEKLISVIKSALDAGWKTMKLYFMIGLPLVEEEASSIKDLAREFAKIGKEYRLRRFINLSVNAFVPKPFTPFQWQGMEDLKTLRQKLDFLKINLDKRFINLKWNNLELSFVEGALARGDRKIGQAILEAYRRGACFDGWDEEFNPEAWRDGFSACGLSLDFYATRRLSCTEILPWEKVNTGVSKEFLNREWERALASEMTPDCREKGCHSCGSFPLPCPSIPVKRGNSVIKEAGPPGLLKNNPDRSFKANVQYSRTGLMRFISHLDTINLWEKVIRMSEIPVTYTRGFNPHPRVTFSEPDPVGVESLCAWLRIDLKEPLNPQNILRALSKNLPEGISISVVNFLKSPTKLFNFVEYLIECPADDIDIRNPENLFDFKINVKKNGRRIALYLPYPQPQGIYKILGRLTDLSKEDIHAFKIKKTKLYQERCL